MGLIKDPSLSGAGKHSRAKTQYLRFLFYLVLPWQSDYRVAVASVPPPGAAAWSGAASAPAAAEPAPASAFAAGRQWRKTRENNAAYVVFVLLQF